MQSIVQPSLSIPAGTRATLLARLLKDKIPIETGFIVSASAFESFVEHNGIQEKLDALFKMTEHTSMREFQSTSRQIKRAILQGEFPEDSAQQILAMYLSLQQPRVMLSPSFFSEEPENPLFTEMESFFYGYQGDANLFEGIKEVWSHFFDSKPLFYRTKHKKEHFSIPFSICVQKQPTYKTTAIVYTDDPTSQTKQTTLIKAVFGEGALIGEIDGADYYWIKRGTGELYNSLYDTQYEKVILANGRQRVESLPPSSKEKRKLSGMQLEMLARYAKDIQQHFFFPQICVVGIDGQRCALIESKQFMPNDVSDPKQRQIASTPISSKIESVPELALPLQVGLMHELTQASHLPIASQINGHISIDSRSFVEKFPSNLQGPSKKLATHELHHVLDFIATHTHAHGGLLYRFDSSFDAPERYSAEIDALLGLHRTHPSLPIGLVTTANTFEEYQRTISLWMRSGFPRSSHVSHILRIQAPATLYKIHEFAQVGIDALIIDIDHVQRAVHGESESIKQPQDSEALLDMVSKGMKAAQEVGVSVIIASTNIPTHAMLKAIQSSVPVEWLTSAKSYVQLTRE